MNSRKKIYFNLFFRTKQVLSWKQPARRRGWESCSPRFLFASGESWKLFHLDSLWFLQVQEIDSIQNLRENETLENARILVSKKDQKQFLDHVDFAMMSCRNQLQKIQ